MKAVFGTINLVPGGVESTSGATVNGQQINDEVQFYRALAATRFARGNRSLIIGFSVERLFATYHLAERFVFEHFTLLPQQDSLYLTIGDGTDTEVVRFDNAVPQSVRLGVQKGLTVPVVYSFACGMPVFSSPSPTLTEPDTTMFKRSSDPITPGATTQTVTFSVAFPGTPVVSKPGVSIPGGGDFLEAWVVAGSVSSTGFQVEFNAACPGSGYTLDWIACG